MNSASETHAEAFEAPTRLFGVVLAGFVTIIAAFGGFLAWGFTAPLDSAAVAHGVVSVLGQRKTVQHLEGGILKAIHVHDGDRVEAGQVLVEIDDTASKAAYEQAEMEYWAAMARGQRLQAERTGGLTVDVTTNGAARSAAHGNSAPITEIFETESNLLVSRWETHVARMAANETRIAQEREQIRAFEAQLQARREQLRITREELKKMDTLVARGYERNSEAVEQRLRVARLNGEFAELVAKIAQSKQAIKEAELAAVNLKNDRVTDIYSQLKETQKRIAEWNERRRAAEDVMKRTRVLAPQRGIVNDLRVHTIGGVISPGERILDIVPLDDELIVEAFLNPNDIDSVHVGLPTRVRLTAYRRRYTPTVQGTLVHVSADMLTDERTGAAYFLARVKLDPQSLEGIERVELYPGMPAEVLILTGQRKAIDYFVSPLVDGMRRALREN